MKRPFDPSYWLVKSEPETWSWQDQIDQQVTPWDGVRNFQARNYMKTMRQGDLALFYQSVTKPQIKGIVEVVSDAYPDAEDPRFVIVDMAFKASFPTCVPLSVLRADPLLIDLPLLKQPRLSVMPLTLSLWQQLLKLGHYPL